MLERKILILFFLQTRKQHSKQFHPRPQRPLKKKTTTTKNCQVIPGSSLADGLKESADSAQVFNTLKTSGLALATSLLIQPRCLFPPNVPRAGRHEDLSVFSKRTSSSVLRPMGRSSSWFGFQDSDTWTNTSLQGFRLMSSVNVF